MGSGYLDWFKKVVINFITFFYFLTYIIRNIEKHILSLIIINY
jgi:hypothetical protein